MRVGRIEAETRNCSRSDKDDDDIGKKILSSNMQRIGGDANNT